MKHDETQSVAADKTDPLFLIGEALRSRDLDNKTLDFSVLAKEFGVTPKDVQDCQIALQALNDAFDEEFSCTTEETPEELPEPELPADYEILSELGRGGMGVVYKARQKSLNREVAVKVLRPGDIHFADMLKRFERESKALAKLRHPHIVSVYEVGRAGQNVYFSMDFVEGSSFAEQLSRSGPLNPSYAVNLLRQLCSAIVYIHSKGLIHRDLKPANILLDETGHVFVVDFGLAREINNTERLTLTGNILGTPAYMSPEQARGDKEGMGEASDVYALGAILYEALTNKRPFSKASIGETLNAVINEDPPYPRSLNKAIPIDLETICMKALSKPLELRYPTAAAMLADLECFQQGRPILASRPSLWSQALSWSKRNQGKALLTSQLALILLILTGWGFYRIGQWRAKINKKRAKKEIYRQKAWNREQDNLAFDITASSLGNPMSKCHLGEALILGIGIKQDQDRGFILLSESIEEGYKPAQSAYHRSLRGLKINNPDGVFPYDQFQYYSLDRRLPQIWTREKQRLQKAADKEQRWALLILALLHKDGVLGFDKDLKKTSQYFLRAVWSPGQWWAHHTRDETDTRLGHLVRRNFYDLYAEPTLISLIFRDESKGPNSLLSGLKQAAKEKNTIALLTLLKFEEEISPQDRIKYAFETLSVGCPTQYWVFEMLLRKESTAFNKEDKKKIIDRILAFEKPGNPIEKGLLAWCFEHGLCSIPKDKQRGIALISQLTKAANNGNKWASRTLTHYHSSYVRDNPKFLSAWLQSIRLGALNLGRPEEAFDHLNIINPNLKKYPSVIKELKKLAKSGNDEARTFLLAMYSGGLFGMSRDLVQAKRWTRKK
jgi:serine/threonine protein kinase